MISPPYASAVVNKQVDVDVLYADPGCIRNGPLGVRTWSSLGRLQLEDRIRVLNIECWCYSLCVVTRVEIHIFVQNSMIKCCVCLLCCGVESVH